MYRTFKALKDTYIVNRVIKGNRTYAANVGQAGSLDLLKIYGNSFSASLPLSELSRVLIQFDLSALKNDFAAGKIDIANSSFNCSLNLFDVYGGQPTPSNFVLKVYPLSQSFDEGLGRDIVFYQDSDISNFLSASFSNGTASLWNSPGADSKGSLGSSNIDLIFTANLGAGTTNMWVTQSFQKGTENLQVDVTKIVSATLAGIIPDLGFRISYTETIESDSRTYFVKRFGSSQAADPYVQPQLVLKYNDAIVSNENNLTFDSQGTLFLYNFVRGNLVNVVSGTALAPIVGANCMLLRLSTPISTSNGVSNYETYITASQHKLGNTYVQGVYSASFTLPSAIPQFAKKLAQSGSIKFDQIWTSFDYTIPYFSGSITVTPPQTSTGPTKPSRYFLNVTNVAEEYLATDVTRMKVFIFDYSSPVITLTRVPLETPSVVVENAFYSIRDVANNTVVIPFDIVYNSTKLSADSQTMYFDVWMSSLIPGRAYTIDLMLIEGGQPQIYRDAAPAFRVTSA